MRIASFNVNSIGVRLKQLTEWAAKANPDIVCLQELKCVEAAFPTEALQDLGYQAAVFGQKTYNGVAILSKAPIEVVRRGLPGEDALDLKAGDGGLQARYLEAIVPTSTASVRIGCIYLPNGNPVGTEKFPYKLAWFDLLVAHAKSLLQLEECVVLAGDYNCIPGYADCHDPAAWAGDALMQPETRARWRKLLNLGFVDAFMARDGRSNCYTFWDYQAGAWAKDHGVRIDHLALSPLAADRLLSCEIARSARAMEKPSDHAPIFADFRF